MLLNQNPSPVLLAVPYFWGDLTCGLVVASARSSLACSTVMMQGSPECKLHFNHSWHK